MSRILNGLGSFLTCTEICNFSSTQPEPVMNRVGSRVITHFDDSNVYNVNMYITERIGLTNFKQNVYWIQKEIKD